VVWFVFVGIIILGLAGCASAPRATEADKVRLVKSNYSAVFEATKAAFFEMGCEITAGSKESGFLNGKRNREGSMGIAVMVGRGSSIVDFFNVSFMDGQDGVTVRLSMTGAYSDGSSYGPGTIKQYYDEFWNNLGRQLAK
jgi:hypothetical protein